MAPPHTDDNLVTKLERLHELPVRWTTTMAYKFVLDDLPAAATSCATFSLTVYNTRNDVVSMAETTTAFAEYLRVLDLVARAGFCPAVLRSKLRHSKPFKGCSFHDWCKFCSGEDRVIALKLTWFGSLKALEAALFDWNDGKGQPDFHAIRRIIGDMENTRGYDDTTPQLVHLALKLQETHACGTTKQQELRDLLARYKDAESCDELQLCRFTRLSVRDLEDASIESVIQSGLDVATNDPFRHWQWVIRAPTSSGATWTPSSTPLARGNVTTLRVMVSRDTEQRKTECDRLHEVLRLQPTRLKKLYVEYGTGIENGATCNELSRMIGDSLFSGQSALRLDQLVIVGHLSRVDVILMLDRLKTQPASKPLRELVLKGWNPRVVGNGNGKDIQLGTTLAALVRQIGGVESLRIERIDGGSTNLLPADVLPLTICREIDAPVNTFA